MMQLFSILFNSQLFVNTFTLTFIAEWGDRSQLATIVLAGINDVVRNKIVAGYQSVSVPIDLIFDIDIDDLVGKVFCSNVSFFIL